MRLLLALTLGLASPETAPSLRGFIDAAQLERYCTALDDDAPDSLGLCLGYIAGVVDQVLARPSRPGDRLCPPADLTVNQARVLVLDYLEDHPRERGAAAALVVEQAMTMAHPCMGTDPLVGRFRR